MNKFTLKSSEDNHNLNKYLIISILIITSNIWAQSPFTSDVDSLILKGFDYTFFTQFDSALSIYQNLTEQYPEHPVGYFYQAATLQSRMMDRESDEHEAEFYKIIEKTLEVGEKYIKESVKDPWVLFYIGSAHSYKGLYQAQSGKLVKGFISAKKGLDYLEQSVKMDSTIYDAYLGLGNYKYWAGKYYKYLKWLPWIRDERDIGFKMVETVVEKSTFSYWVGINSLGWIEVDRGNLNEAAILFTKGLELYPESRFFLWGLGSSYLKGKSYIQAVIAYKKILDSLKGENQNGYNEAECRLKLAQCYYALEYYRECKTHAEAILNLNISPNIKKRIQSHRNEAKKLIKQSQEQINTASNQTATPSLNNN